MVNQLRDFFGDRAIMKLNDMINDMDEVDTMSLEYDRTLESIKGEDIEFKTKLFFCRSLAKVASRFLHLALRNEIAYYKFWVFL